MITLDELTSMWAKDASINGLALDESTITGAKLHSKYLEHLSLAKMILKKKEQSQAILLRDKWLYFNGKMDKTEMDKRGWPYDPFNGLKILKADLEYYFNADPDLQKSDEVIVYYKTMVTTLEEILGTLKWRHSQIKNILAWRQFEAGN